MKSIAQQYDCLLIDLDGTVFRGAAPTTGAVQALDEVHSRKLYITNNASRSPDEVAAHLRELGFTVTGEDVVTSAQSAAHLLAAELPPESPVLIVGTEALADEIAAVGLWQDPNHHQPHEQGDDADERDAPGPAAPYPSEPVHGVLHHWARGFSTEAVTSPISRVRLGRGGMVCSCSCTQASAAWVP
jgi:ribonucleotide monophosphatase NagD (HAD superfamily)